MNLSTGTEMALGVRVVFSEASTPAFPAEEDKRGASKRASQAWPTGRD